MREPKLFGIGLSKTGTTSLHRALLELGFKAKDFPSVRYIPHFLLWLKKRELEQYNAFTDISFLPFVKRLDQQFPGSKFILTVRDKESWLESCRKYPRYSIPTKQLPWKIVKLRQLVYGSVQFDEQKWGDAFDRHHEWVANYFKDRQEDLLRINIIDGEGWEKLCGFLDLSIPDTPFPVRNSRAAGFKDVS